MTEPPEDFAAMFEASIQAKRFERGQTLEGTIVAMGPEECPGAVRTDVDDFFRGARAPARLP